ncbi:acid sphingomyelinase [Multifurca ochricompacta]|uniref:Sphingomyelin phosphodiesterase n=1 Tax=Multifurca ochricompacta TaxID=376703 RepID=A0AAD4QJ61_9AGAM|nr:acid sphingomyelinase [Multifurca ochricompacta]
MFLHRRATIVGLSALTLFSHHAQASVFTDILNAFKSSRDCNSCHGILIPALQAASNTDTDFVGNLTALCTVAKLADNDVCIGDFALAGPILAHSLRGMSSNGTTATKLCSAVFGLCQPPPVTPFTVPLPPPTFDSHAQPVPLYGIHQPFKVVHMSDVHVDRSYSAGADANCTKPICCRHFADEANPPREPAGAFGESRCDSPIDLAQSMLGAIRQVAGDARFAVLTGDVVAHDTWLANRSEVTVDLDSWNDEMLGGLPFKIYPALGNHDTSPVNSFPKTGTHSNITSQWVYDLEETGWQPWIGRAAGEQEDHTSGSYAIVVPETNLRVISINTMFWYRQNLWLYDTDTPIPDPNGILAFLAHQLQVAEGAGQRAWVIGHIPPGVSDFDHDSSNYYNQIVQRYKGTIAGQFFGHTHKDEFQIAYSDFSNRNAATADSIVWIAPSLTPTDGNPAFRVYDIDPDTFDVVDSKTYIALILGRDSYGPLISDGGLKPTDPLDAPFWHAVTEAFVANDTAFQLYNARKSRVNIGDVPACTGACKNQTICQNQAARSQDNCVSRLSFLVSHSHFRFPLHLPPSRESI